MRAETPLLGNGVQIMLLHALPYLLYKPSNVRREKVKGCF